MLALLYEDKEPLCCMAGQPRPRVQIRANLSPRNRMVFPKKLLNFLTRVSWQLRTCACCTCSTCYTPPPWYSNRELWANSKGGKCVTSSASSCERRSAAVRSRTQCSPGMSFKRGVSNRCMPSLGSPLPHGKSSHRSDDVVWGPWSTLQGQIEVVGTLARGRNQIWGGGHGQENAEYHTYTSMEPPNYAAFAF